MIRQAVLHGLEQVDRSTVLSKRATVTPRPQQAITPSPTLPRGEP